MPTFNAGAQARLKQAHPLLQQVMNEAIKEFNFTILDSQRGKAAQEKAFNEHKSKAHFGQSAHNWTPSIALDVAPLPIDWNNTAKFEALAAVVMRIAKEQKVPLRWGGDWDMDGKRNHSGLIDLPHYELTPWRDFAAHCKPFTG